MDVTLSRPPGSQADVAVTTMPDAFNLDGFVRGARVSRYLGMRILSLPPWGRAQRAPAVIVHDYMFDQRSPGEQARARYAALR